MAEQTLPTDIHVLERGWLSSNSVLLGGDVRGAVLVDTGYCTHAEQTAALIAQALADDGASPRLRLIVNTHLHSDHCGGNAYLQGVYLCPIWIPPGDFESARNWNEARLNYRLTGQQCPRFNPAASIGPGSVLEQAGRRWQIHAAPGHDTYAILMFDPVSRILISADALWEHGFGIVFPEIDGESAFESVGATLDLIESLEPELIIPGHGAPFARVVEAIKEARSRLAFFQRHPERHARHAAKALIMFHMLEVRSETHADLIQWLLSTPIHQSMHGRFFASTPIGVWSEDLLQDLKRSGAIVSAGGRLGVCE